MMDKLKRRVAKASRERKLDHFYSLFEEGMKVTDVGVAPDVKTKAMKLPGFVDSSELEPQFSGWGQYSCSKRMGDS